MRMSRRRPAKVAVHQRLHAFASICAEVVHRTRAGAVELTEFPHTAGSTRDSTSHVQSSTVTSRRARSDASKASVCRGRVEQVWTDGLAHRPLHDHASSQPREQSIGTTCSAQPVECGSSLAAPRNCNSPTITRQLQSLAPARVSTRVGLGGCAHRLVSCSLDCAPRDMIFFADMLTWDASEARVATCSGPGVMHAISCSIVHRCESTTWTMYRTDSTHSLRDRSRRGRGCRLPERCTPRDQHRIELMRQSHAVVEMTALD